MDMDHLPDEFNDLPWELQNAIERMKPFRSFLGTIACIAASMKFWPKLRSMYTEAFKENGFEIVDEDKLSIIPYDIEWLLKYTKTGDEVNFSVLKSFYEMVSMDADQDPLMIDFDLVKDDVMHKKVKEIIRVRINKLKVAIAYQDEDDDILDMAMNLAPSYEEVDIDTTKKEETEESEEKEDVPFSWDQFDD